ncbi:MAG: hypothetical protein DYG89_32185 [Caldilinea sp. CFX5]|nr:hypothetical protein [Caldilinea sp. CFX5]
MFLSPIWTPSQVEGIKRTLVDTFEYRLHVIKIKAEEGASTAQIYDGTRKIFETHGADREQALRAAERWIDEQDELTPVNDLHRAAVNSW